MNHGVDTLIKGYIFFKRWKLFSIPYVSGGGECAPFFHSDIEPPEMIDFEDKTEREDRTKHVKYAI